MYKKPAFSLDINGFPIELRQYARKQNSFSVRYGAQNDHELTYAEACRKLGEAILHALACESLIDNERN